VSMRLLLRVAFTVVIVALALLAIYLVPVPAIQGGIAGALFSLFASQLTLFVDRYLRERGEVIFEVKGQGWIGSSRLYSPEEFSPEEAAERISQASDHELALFYENRDFEVRFRNTKEVGVSLWDISVVFSRGEQHLSILDAYDAPTGSRLDLLNIPAKEAKSHVVRVWVSQSAEKMRQAWEADRVEMAVTVVGEGRIYAALPRWSASDIAS
jgi:hypothetical protein